MRFSSLLSNFGLCSTRSNEFGVPYSVCHILNDNEVHLVKDCCRKIILSEQYNRLPAPDAHKTPGLWYAPELEQNWYTDPA